MNNPYTLVLFNKVQRVECRAFYIFCVLKIKHSQTVELESEQLFYLF